MSASLVCATFYLLHGGFFSTALSRLPRHRWLFCSSPRKRATEHSLRLVEVRLGGAGRIGIHIALSRIFYLLGPFASHPISAALILLAFHTRRRPINLSLLNFQRTIYFIPKAIHRPCRCLWKNQDQRTLLAIFFHYNLSATLLLLWAQSRTSPGKGKGGCSLAKSLSDLQG